MPIRMRMEDEGIPFERGRSASSREVVFTTHTPLPAGHDRSTLRLIEEQPWPLRECTETFEGEFFPWGLGPGKSKF